MRQSAGRAAQTDVGRFMPDGSFQFTFNIFTPETDTTINFFGVPDGFRAEPLSVDQVLYIELELVLNTCNLLCLIPRVYSRRL